MRRKGFTLIELLVVIAIIALLVSILMPSLAKARELAKRAGCAMNMSNIGKATALYKNNNRDQYPFAVQGAAGAVGAHAAALQATTPAAFNPSTDVPTVVIDTKLADAFLLVVDGQSTKQFLCPSDSNAKDDPLASKTVGAVTTWGTTFNAQENCSYGWQAPMAPASGTVNICGISDAQPSAVFMADKPSAAPVPASATPADWKPSMSQNHSAGEYVNALRADSSVVNGRNAQLGVNSDEIYTKSSTATTGDNKGVAPAITANNNYMDSCIWY